MAHAFPKLVALAACALHGAQAELYHFEATPFPAKYSAHALHVFYVESGGRDRPALLTFPNLVMGTQRDPAKLQTYNSLQVAILPFDRFWSVVDRKKFCSTETDVKKGFAKSLGQFIVREPGHTYVKTIAPQRQGPAPFEVTESGRYILMYANCGPESDGFVSGDVVLKNPWGHLPANERSAYLFFGWLTMLCLLVSMVWGTVVVRNYKFLLHIHSTIGFVAALALSEAITMWVQYHDWNSRGQRRDSLVLAGLLFNTLKQIASWRLVLLASLGTGMTLEEMPACTLVKFTAASLGIMIAQCVWRMVLAMRYAYALSPLFMVAICIPGMLVNSGMFVWSIVGLNRLTGKLSERRLEGAAKAFHNANMLLVMAMVLGALISSVQVIDCALDGIFGWKPQWLIYEAFPAICFLFVLSCMMKVLVPDQSNYDFTYAPAESNEAPGAAEELEEVDAEGARMLRARQADEPRGTRSNAVAPEAIGAGTEKEAQEEGQAEEGESLMKF